MAHLDPAALVEEYKLKSLEEKEKDEYAWKRNLSAQIQQHTNDAAKMHRRGNYEGSFDKFANALALIEVNPKTQTIDETRAATVFNLGSALHFLGNPDMAKEYYEAALDEFQKSPDTWFTWLVVGSVNKKRILHIQLAILRGILHEHLTENHAHLSTWPRILVG